MALLHFPRPQIQAGSSFVVGGQLEERGSSKRLSSCAHVGIGNDPHFVFLHCRTTVRRVRVDRQKLPLAVYDVQEVDNEETGNSGPWERGIGAPGGKERARGRGRGGIGGRGGGGRVSDSTLSRGYGGERESRSSRSNFRRDDRDQDSQRASSSLESHSERGGFRGESGGRGVYEGGSHWRGEGRSSSFGRGRGGSSRGGYGGRSDSRQANGGSSRAGYGGRVDSRGESGDKSFARGSYGKGRGARVEDGANNYGAGGFSTRDEPREGSDDREGNMWRGEFQRESRGRGNILGRNGSRDDFSGNDDIRFRVNLPPSDLRGQGSFGRGNSAPRSGSRGREPWESSQGREQESKGPSPTFQTVTPRQSTSKFVSDRAVYKAPWEQGSDSEPVTRSFGERDFLKQNPLIDRLQQVPANKKNTYDSSNNRESDDAETRYFDGKGEKSAMSRIVEKLSNIPGSRKIYEPRNKGGRSDGSNIFIPKSSQPMFPMVQRGWGTPDHPIPTPAEVPRKKRPDTRFPWEREDDEASLEDASSEKQKRVKPPSLAELTIPEGELKRLRSLGILARHRIKVGKAGVTQGIVESVHNEWRDSEIVRVKCEGPPAMNMKRTHEDLEGKTGGLVIWRAGGACLIYRGKDYVPPPLRGLLGAEGKEFLEEVEDVDENPDISMADDENEIEGEEEVKGENNDSGEPAVNVPRIKSAYDPDMERELEEILSALGPRYEDWSGGKPVPVDADQLVDQEVTYKKPYRLLPYGVKPSLSNTEMTDLRRLARPIPPHFVLGRNRGLDGLAAAIVKLWERSEIAKIAVKRGVQNTNHERMGEELKRLTGGVLLARDKFFIVLYRGKDFLPPSVAAALAERQAMTQALQEEEEKVRLLPRSTSIIDPSESLTAAVAGTLSETLEAKANWEVWTNSDEERINRENARLAAKKDLTRRIERKLAITMAKKQKAELELEKVEKRLRPAGPPMDRELITEEEMHMYTKLGLKMKAFLLLGRRGVFDGTIENMHLHWKHRELVKIIYKARNKIDLEQTAKMLEYESGGILVGTIATSKGQAILVYRGKNYSRPPELRPRSLLTKRQALKRSIELQRQEALERHMLTLEKEIDFMRADLIKLGAEEGEITDRASDPSPELEEEDKYISYPGGELPAEAKGLVGDGGGGYLSKRGQLGPIFRADPLSRKEKLKLRQNALKAKRAAHFNVGGSNVVAGLARAIRIHFQRHALVKVGVKGRAKGTPVEEIIMQLENATGGTLVSQETSKIILYRGWPDGEERPKQNWLDGEDELTPELRNAMMTEEGMDEPFLDEEERDSEWDEEDEDSDDAEISDINTVGKLYFEDDSDWDKDEDLDEDDQDDFVSQWQEDGAVSRGFDGSDRSISKLAAATSGTSDFEYEDDADDDVDFEWNEVEEDVIIEEDDESHSTEVIQSRTQT